MSLLRTKAMSQAATPASSSAALCFSLLIACAFRYLSFNRLPSLSMLLTRTTLSFSHHPQKSRSTTQTICCCRGRSRPDVALSMSLCPLRLHSAAASTAQSRSMRAPLPSCPLLLLTQVRPLTVKPQPWFKLLPLAVMLSLLTSASFDAPTGSMWVNLFQSRAEPCADVCCTGCVQLGTPCARTCF